MTSNIVNNLIL